MRRADLAIGCPQQEDLLGLAKVGSSHVLAHVVELHAFLEDAVLAHDVDRDLRIFVRGAWLRKHHPPGGLQHTAETRHRLLAIRYMMCALEGENGIDDGASNRQVLDVGDDEMRPIFAHPLHADFKIRPADVDADGFYPALVQPLCRPGVPASAVDQRISGLELEKRNGGAEELDQVQREFGAVRVERRRITWR